MAKEFVWNGVIYPSAKAAAEELHLSSQGAYYRRRKRLTSDADLNRGNRKPIIVDGQKYPSQHAAAVALGLSDAAISLRLKRQKGK